MAMKTIPGSTGIGVEAAAMDLNLEIMQGCLQVGELRAVDAAIEEVLPKDPLSEETCEKTMRLAHQVCQLAERITQWELSLESEPISSVDGLVRLLLTTQFNTFNEQFQVLKRNVSFTIDDVSGQALQGTRELQPVFEKAVGQYLQTRNHNDAEAASQCGRNLDVFNRTVQNLTDAKNQLSGVEVKHPYQKDPVQERIGQLERLIGNGYYYGRVESVFLKLDQVVEEGDISALDDFWGMNKETINRFIDNLHEQVGSDQVNYWVWKLSGEKAGENYGEVHRYDDLGILKEAILRTRKSLADKIMKEEAANITPDQVYAKLYEIIGKPEVDNWRVWMKENACYYTGELRDAINDVKFARRVFQTLEEFGDEIPCFNFNGFSEPPRYIPPQKHEFTSIFEELDGASSIQPELRERIEAMIGRLSENGLADTINYEIWRLGGEKPGDNWGVVHRYDDPAVLRQALMIAVRRDVQNVVVKTFIDEEDLNAFYAQITEIAFEDKYDGVPSDINPIAYGKENIVFHLHRIGDASEVVRARIEQRREEKARESDKAMNQLIEAAIAKNPAAQSLADMLNSINHVNRLIGRPRAVEECKAQIKAKIEGPDFAADLRNQIFIGIWRANEEPTGDSNYGLHHYLDDLDVLSQVLLNIVIEIGINGEQ
ncbi:MAG: hypothetical protein KF898_00155 [Parachlamydiales bacterium]|nr:hypothetical protein [Candidatus Acheromyda pituitae]